MKRIGRSIPAAHSMDTQWYAVDENGHVAQMHTSEGGAVPVGGGFPESNSWASGPLLVDDELLVGAALDMLSKRDDDVAAVLGDFGLTAGEVARSLLWGLGYRSQSVDVRAEWNALGCLGLFVYRCQSQSSAPYPLVVRPSHPLRLDFLPEGIRAQFQPGFWPEQFTDQQLIQPAEGTECRTWGGYWVDRQGEMHILDSARLEPDEQRARSMLAEANSIECHTADHVQFLDYLAFSCTRTIKRQERESSQ